MKEQGIIYNNINLTEDDYVIDSYSDNYYLETFIPDSQNMSNRKEWRSIMQSYL